MSSERGPLDDVARGAIKGALDWTAEKVRELVRRFRDRKLAFVSDPEIINTVKEQRKTPEWIFFRDNVKDADFRILFQIGLTLRKLENEGRSREIRALKEKVFRKYNKRGLHIAQVVQNGIFSKYIGIILERTPTPEILKSEILDLFTNIENRAVFIQSRNNVKKETDLIVAKISANSPNTFIFSSMGRAMDICEKVQKSVIQRISDYKSELYRSDIKRIYFLNKVVEIT